MSDGELSKAARDIDGPGVAEPTVEVISELRRKYPKRRQDVRWPNIDEIMREIDENLESNSPSLENVRVSNTSPEDKRMEIEGIEQKEECAEDDEKERETREEKATRWLEENSSRTFIKAESVEIAVKRIRKSTGGGPKQITPWMLKQAVESSTDGSCALMIAKLSNRSLMEIST